MSRLVVPVRYRTLWATGDILLRAELDLLLADHRGAWKQETFLIDSGSEITTVPASLAKKLDLPMPQKPAGGVVHQQTGLEIRSGFLRAQVAGMDGTADAIPCFFLGDPDAPPGANPPSAVPRKLLGLSGVIDQLRILFDGTPTQGAPYGNGIVEKQ